VSYNRSTSTTLGLDIPLEAAVNADELAQYAEHQQKRARLRESSAEGQAPGDAAVSSGQGVSGKAEGEERVLPRVPLAACLERFAGDSLVEDYQSAALGRKTKVRPPWPAGRSIRWSCIPCPGGSPPGNRREARVLSWPVGACDLQASKCVRLSSFPPYLLIQLRRYYVAEDWTPRKMEVRSSTVWCTQPGLGHPVCMEGASLAASARKRRYPSRTWRQPPSYEGD
jgi:ubiquitin carboxyl-terminal hydrolase 5/13